MCRVIYVLLQPSNLGFLAVGLLMGYSHGTLFEICPFLTQITVFKHSGVTLDNFDAPRSMSYLLVGSPIVLAFPHVASLDRGMT